MKKTLIIALTLTLLAPAAMAKKEKTKKEKEPPHEYVVKMNNGNAISGILSQDWVRWPAKSINVDFKIKQSDGTEQQITVNEIDTIYDMTDGRKFVAVNLPYPRIGKTGNIVKWIAKCGPKSEHGEVLTYTAWYNFQRGTFFEWGLAETHCMRFENDSIAYPFYYPPQNGEFNTSIMKKKLKEIRPEAVEYLTKYFKSNKEQRKQLQKHPELFLEAYEDFIQYNK